jgi:hypothetical protein
MSVTFQAAGHGGKIYKGKGRVEGEYKGGFIVRLSTDNFLGHGTYLKGNLIRVNNSEIISK